MFEHSVTELSRDLAYAPAYINHWVTWLFFVAVISPLFFAIWVKEARILVVAQVANAIVGSLIVMQFGPVRLLGLAHVICWTPAVYLVWNSMNKRPWTSFVGIWLRIVVATMIISLVIDYYDVARWLLGDRAPLVEGWRA